MVRTNRHVTPFSAWVREVTIGGVLAGIAADPDGVPVTRKAVYHWLAGRSSPPLMQAAVVVRISAGRVSFNDLVQHRTEATHGRGGEGGMAGGAPHGTRRD